MKSKLEYRCIDMFMDCPYRVNGKTCGYNSFFEFCLEKKIEEGKNAEKLLEKLRSK